MAKERSERSGLEAIRAADAHYRVAQTMGEKANEYHQNDNFMKYLQNSGKTPEQAKEIMQDPVKFTQEADRAYKAERKNLADAVADNLPDAIGVIGSQKIIGAAWRLSDKEEHLQLVKMISQKDAEGIRHALYEMYDNRLYRSYVLGSTADQLLQAASAEVSIDQAQFAKKNLYTEVVREGKKVGGIEVSKAVGFIAGKLKKLDPREREEFLINLMSRAA